MRISGGIHKNRKIATKLEGVKLGVIRPSSNKVRQAIFNVINSAPFISEDFLNKALVLDLFCGSGALGLEAISRGARYVTFVDINSAHLELVKTTALVLNELNKCHFIVNDANHLFASNSQFNLIFLDPPYDNPEFINNTIIALIKNNWIADDNLIIIERSKKLNHPSLPYEIEILLNKIYGISDILFCRLLK